MPSSKILEQKQQIVSTLVDKLSNAVSGVLVDYKGITVAEDTKLRAELRAENIDYFVVKNSLLRFAAQQVNLSGLIPVLEGTTAIAISNTDCVAPAKIIAKYSDQLKERFNIKAGFVEGKVASVAEIENLAKLPSKEVLISMVLAGLNSPITSFANVLNANIRGLVVALDAIAQKKSA